MGKMLSDLKVDLAGMQDCSISGVTADSRMVTQSFLFAAMPGVDYDGRAFIAEAIEKGATVILSTLDTVLPDDAPDSVQLINSDDVRADYARIAARFYDVMPPYIAAVTGTNGKTSVADFTRQIWKHQGFIAASIGTLGVRSDLLQTPGGLTTPDPVKLHMSMSQVAHTGVTHCALEASSHGLHQKRLEGAAISAAAFTNLTRDHLDYHASEDCYYQAKVRLFSELLMDGGFAAVNIDDEYGEQLVKVLSDRQVQLVTVGRNEKADVVIENVEAVKDGLRLEIQLKGEVITYVLPLMGYFQAENAVLAAVLASSADLSLKSCLKSMEHLEGVSGRMQHIGSTQSGGAVYVDFAHTPDGLETVLKAASDHATGSLDVVFGCGGNRDKGKRPIMGEIARKLATRVYVTDDNPRFEDAAEIRQGIMVACPDAYEIADRGQAIKKAIHALDEGDILILAGKGHEEGQIIDDEKIMFSDIHTAHKILRGEDV